MNRTSINPTDWGLQFRMDQGEVVDGHSRTLRCSGQVAAVPDDSSPLGFRVDSPNEIRGQMERALKNIDDILEQAGMSRSDIVSLRFFTTDIDGFLENYDVYAEWIAPANIRPPQSLIGVARLVLPELCVEIEMEAAV
ncbi:MAG: RidA family protein [Rhodothermia bacterium]|nr:RidA family protein [Rhodothermia bacterium]